MRAKYIGEDCVYTDQYAAKSVMLERDKEYDVEVHNTSPVFVVNGQHLISSDASIIITVEGCRIPYEPNRVEYFWNFK